MGYLTSSSLTNYYTKHQIDTAGFLLTESDPIFANSTASHVTTSDIVSRDEAHGR
ncbi:MAG: hypothetical protein WCP92_08195 [bacterium]